MSFVNSKTPLISHTGYFYEGKEIALEKKSGYPTKLARHKGDWWPEDKRIEAATVYAVTKNFEQTSLLVKIPVSVLRRMAVLPWWSETVAKVIKGRNEALDAKITDTLDKTLDLIQDRLENGETYYNTKREATYKLPVRAKDAAVITSVLFDKRQLIRGEATTRSETITSDQKLLALKENFEKLARSKQINPNSEPIEGEVTDAEFSELRPGLHTGTEDGVSQAQTPETGTEQSSFDVGEDGFGEEGRWEGSGSQDPTLDGGLEQPFQFESSVSKS
jgi:hypothetical protein